ncbi:hypothetical protein V7654_07880 [Bacillus sp. JJ1609]|uniref:hypothetical protein n=1 Tax=Bacillus sp. JJ1609 TaxID=3122977 RepID=UPI002FFFFAED
MGQFISSTDKIKVNSPKDCGNAPKKLQLQELTIAFASLEIDAIKVNISDDIVWEIVGEKPLQGKDSFLRKLKEMAHRQVTEIHISNIITHGSTSSINGKMIMNDESSLGFCDVYTFTGAGKKAKIKEITSYIIHLM